MKKLITFLSISALAVAACATRTPDTVEYIDGSYMEYDTSDAYDMYPTSVVAWRDSGGQTVARSAVPAANTVQPQMIKYSMPNGNDLVLDTGTQRIEIAAKPGQQYAYYVWAGEKDTTEDPDLIVRDGVAAILVEE